MYKNTTFKEKLEIFKVSISVKKLKTSFLINRKIDDIYYFFSGVKSTLISNSIFMKVVILCTLTRLKIQGKRGVEIEKSPYSESIYIYYESDRVEDRNYESIRISLHPNPSSKADKFITLI